MKGNEGGEIKESGEAKGEGGIKRRMEEAGKEWRARGEGKWTQREIREGEGGGKWKGEEEGGRGKDTFL